MSMQTEITKHSTLQVEAEALPFRARRTNLRLCAEFKLSIELPGDKTLVGVAGVDRETHGGRAGFKIRWKMGGAARNVTLGGGAKRGAGGAAAFGAGGHTGRTAVAALRAGGGDTGVARSPPPREVTGAFLTARMSSWVGLTIRGGDMTRFGLLVPACAPEVPGREGCETDRSAVVMVFVVIFFAVAFVIADFESIFDTFSFVVTGVVLMSRFDVDFAETGTPKPLGGTIAELGVGGCSELNGKQKTYDWAYLRQKCEEPNNSKSTKKQTQRTKEKQTKLISRSNKKQQ